MKVTEKGPSKWLSQYDLAAPLVAIIADCRRQEVKGNYGTDMCDILYFAGAIKPLILRTITRRTIIAAYGDESDLWRGKPLEVYYDATVQNSSSMGAIRVRIPPPTSPPTQPPASKPAPAPTLKEVHGLVMDAYRNAKTLDTLKECRGRAAKYAFPRELAEAQAALYQIREKALAPKPAAPNAQPVRR